VNPHRNRAICRYFLRHPQISPIIRVGEVPGSNPGAPIGKPRKCGVFCWASSGWLGQRMGSKAGHRRLEWLY
jgi:hypothetical protein